MADDNTNQNNLIIPPVGQNVGPQPVPPEAQNSAQNNVQNPAQNNVQPPAPAGPSTAQQVATDIEQGADKAVASLQNTIYNWLKGIYNQNKILFYTVIPIMGLIYLAIKYHNLLISILVKSSGQVLQDEQAKDDALAQQAQQSQQQAEDLAQQANDLPNQEKPVDDDWYKK